jgi:hypothetical protein
MINYEKEFHDYETHHIVVWERPKQGVNRFGSVRVRTGSELVRLGEVLRTLSRTTGEPY